MLKMVLYIAAALLLAASALAKPQVLVDAYGYYTPAYVASYGTQLAYPYPYAYAYTYPWGYY